MNSFEELLDIEAEEIVLSKNNKRAIRRKKDISKALRKKNIIESNGRSMYDNLHQYSKNKIHCSCQMCRFRGAWNPDAKTESDMRKLEKTAYDMLEYTSGEADAVIAAVEEIKTA